MSESSGASSWTADTTAANEELFTEDFDPVLGESLVLGGMALVDPFTADTAADLAPSAQARVWLVGASGGVGVSSLATWCGEVVAEGFDPARWDGLPGFSTAGGWYGGVPVGAPVWIVARVDPRSLEAARVLAGRWSRAELPWTVAGLVLAYGPEGTGKKAVNTAKAISRLFPQTVSLPWQEADEIGQLAELSQSHRRIRATVATITATENTAHLIRPATTVAGAQNKEYLK